MLLLKVVGLFKTILIIIAVMVIIRFINNLMQAKNANQRKKDQQLNKAAFEKEKKESEKNLGKTAFFKGKPADVEDVDFEEVK